ncbi:aminotransferase class I and II [Sphingobacterium sp. DK4209]|uniref:Aminotransferase class I and II n=1 Tax=Sphingobacterium zhuxiongii TaxID=2662364 RepID=A0A5Q0QDD4_9SPHI|nr:MULTISPECIES: HipA family kinase [unclassified Sphingobacterium]MVZ66899.1 aminotransferase class I and II [Sphingobacterium sp. DK4209]QGA25542.1 aminotransferase class I and II [Sphingobacterium sp. dk4302]
MEIKNPEIREVNIIRYIQPFREGGSLPGLVDADDGFSYVIKFRGAGQGKKALVAEFIGAELARMIGLRVPEMVFAHLDVGFGRTEPDEEIQDLLKFSEGMNLGVHYLNGSITFDANVDTIAAEEASKIVWLDALLMNVDRTAKNTNMLVWHKDLWMIDYGAALYFHHSWDNWEEQTSKPFVQIKDHVLLKQATEVSRINDEYKVFFTRANVAKVLAAIPDEWLIDEVRSLSADDARTVYVEFIARRAEESEVFVNQIQDAR